MTSTRAPVNGCSNASRVAWRNCRSSPSSSGPPYSGSPATGRSIAVEMDPDLVRPPGLQRDAKQRVPRQQLLYLEVRHRLARRVRVERLPHRIATVAADRRVDRPAAGLRPADDECEVLARQRARLHQLLEPPVRLGRAGDDEQPRRVPVEAVDDPRPFRLLPALDVVGEQPVDERSLRMAGRRMDDETGRLVDDEQVLVLVRHGEVDLLRDEPARPRRGRLELELLAADEPVALRTRPPVDEHAAVLDQPLGDRPRPDLRKQREEAVEPRPASLLRDAQPRHARAATGAARARPRRARRAEGRPRSR